MVADTLYSFNLREGKPEADYAAVERASYGS